MRFRIPIFIEDILLRNGLQNAVQEGEDRIPTGIEIYHLVDEQGSRAFLEIHNFRNFIRFLFNN